MFLRAIGAVFGVALSFGFAEAQTFTSVQWGANRGASPWQIGVYDQSNTAQPVFTLPATGGGPKLLPSACPSPTNSTLGCIESISPVSHEWVEYIDTSGVQHLLQPTLSDISGLATGVATALGIAPNAAGGFVSVPNTDSCVYQNSASAVAGCGTTLPSGLTIPEITSLTIGNPSNYQPTNGYFAGATAVLTGVGGSQGSPDSGDNPLGILQRWTNYAGANNNTTLYVSINRETATNGSAARAGFFEAQDFAGWDETGQNTFVEGVKGSAFLQSTATHGSAYGGVFVGYTASAQYLYLIGAEASALNDYSDAPSTFAPGTFAAAFVGGNGGTHSIDAVYTVGPYPTSGGSAIRGYYVPNSGDAYDLVTGCAFCSDNTVADVLDGPSKNIRILPGGAIFNAATTPPSLGATAQSAWYNDANEGGLLQGEGASWDVTLVSSGGAKALGVVHNSNWVEVFGEAVIDGELNAHATTASTSTTTGAIVDAGGLGVAGAAFIGGTIGQNLATAWSGAYPGIGNVALYSQQTYTGSPTGSGFPFSGGNGIPLSLSDITSDELVWTTGGGVDAWMFKYAYGGGSTAGDRLGLVVDMNQTGAVASGTNNNNALDVLQGSFANVTGAASGPNNGKGSYFAIGTNYCRLNSGIFVHECNSWEADLLPSSGSTSDYVEFTKLVNFAPSGWVPNVFGAFMTLSSENGALLQYGLLFGDPQTNGGISFPITSGGTLIGSYSAGTAGVGIDFSNLTLTDFLKGPNSFVVDGNGNIVGSGATIGGGSKITSSGPGGALTAVAFQAAGPSKTCGATIVVTNGVITSC